MNTTIIYKLRTGKLYSELKEVDKLNLNESLIKIARVNYNIPEEDCRAIIDTVRTHTREIASVRDANIDQATDIMFEKLTKSIPDPLKRLKALDRINFALDAYKSEEIMKSISITGNVNAVYEKCRVAPSEYSEDAEENLRKKLHEQFQNLSKTPDALVKVAKNAAKPTKLNWVLKDSAENFTIKVLSAFQIYADKKTQTTPCMAAIAASNNVELEHAASIIKVSSVAEKITHFVATMLLIAGAITLTLTAIGSAGWLLAGATSFATTAASAAVAAKTVDTFSNLLISIFLLFGVTYLSASMDSEIGTRILRYPAIGIAVITDIVRHTYAKAKEILHKLYIRFAAAKRYIAETSVDEYATNNDTDFDEDEQDFEEDEEYADEEYDEELITDSDDELFANA